MNRDRNTLKGFFKKGAIPSQENFADLIDSAINQADDGIAKLPNDPLRINASGPGENVLNFYQKAADSKRAWALSLNSGDATPKAGLNISSIAKGSRLFIDYDSGKVGIGSSTPRASLDVNGEIVAVNRLTLAQDTSETKQTWHVDNSSGIFRLFWQKNIKTAGTDAVVVTTAGDVGIGTSNPVAKLDIGGDANLHLGLKVDGGGLIKPDENLKAQGAYLGWNGLTGHSGETDFINNQGGGSGGFAFINSWTNKESETVPRKTLMFITGAGKVCIGTKDAKGSLEVYGELFQMAPMIECGKGDQDWRRADHPIYKYFKEKLYGCPQGTILFAMADAWETAPEIYYFIGCVCAHNKAYFTAVKLGDALAIQ
jgi:hypothetical protein